MRKNLGIILATAMLMEYMQSTKTIKRYDSREYTPEPKRNTYTEFTPNHENTEYRKKFLGVKKKGFKK